MPTVQDLWSQRLCRYGLVGLTVQHADHGQCHIVESNFLTREASTHDLYLWLVPNQDSISRIFPRSGQVFPYKSLILLSVLHMRGSRPSAYILRKLLEPGRESPTRAESRLDVVWGRQARHRRPLDVVGQQTEPC